jgi:hypothetical protein
VDDELVFPHKAKEVCREKSSKISDMNFLNRALNHTKVACTWDEPETDNRRCAMLFQDGIENKVDIDEYLAPEVDSRSSTSEEVEKDEGMVEENMDEEDEEESSVSEEQNIYSDFDKKNRKRGGMKVTFKNPFESKAFEAEDNALGKRVYSMKKAKKFDAEEEPGENEGNFFEGFPEEEDEELAEFARGKGEEKLNKKDKFKERMKEKKRQVKLDKEARRLEKAREKEGRRLVSDRRTEELQLLVGDEEDREEFVPAFVDPRFERFKKDPNMKIDPTSNLFSKSRHGDLLKKIKL